MARPVLTDKLFDFTSVVKAMRTLGVQSWSGSPVGDVVLGAAPVAPGAKPPEADPKATRRAYYAEVFGRPVTDPELEKLP